MDRKFIFEDCALRLLQAKTDDLMLKCALARMLNSDIFFEVGDTVILRGDGLWNEYFGEVKRIAHTRDGLRYDVLIDEGITGNEQMIIEGLTDDDMELYDDTAYREYMERLHGISKKNE